jgi:hypothetical protein
MPWRWTNDHTEHGEPGPRLQTSKFTGSAAHVAPRDLAVAPRAVPLVPRAAPHVAPRVACAALDAVLCALSGALDAAPFLTPVLRHPTPLAGSEPLRAERSRESQKRKCFSTRDHQRFAHVQASIRSNNQEVYEARAHLIEVNSTSQAHRLVNPLKTNRASLQRRFSFLCEQCGPTLPRRLAAPPHRRQDAAQLMRANASLHADYARIAPKDLNPTEMPSAS